MTVNEALYQLELSLPVSHEDVRLAFRKMAKRFHPDLYSEIKAQQSASLKFIEAKNASDYLLKLPEEAINNIRKRPLVDQRLRPDRPVKPTVPLKIPPIIKELDNIALLFHFINLQGNEKIWWKNLKKFNFNPGEIIGKWYEFLIERSFPGERNLGKIGFALYRLFRLINGSIVLIVGMLLMSIAGLFGTIVFLPAFGIFYLSYHFYNIYLEKISSKLNKTIIPNDFNSWRKAKAKYLKYRFSPLILFIAVALVLIYLAQIGSFFLFSIACLYSMMVILLLLSIISEYLIFNKSVKKNNAAFS